MLKIGITGNIGSGKSTVARIFETFDVPVFYADDEGKKMLEIPQVKQKIKKLFGEEIFDLDKIDRKKLAAVVFSDKEKLEQLNAIIHPAVKAAFEKEVQKQKGRPYLLYEAAIMIETGGYKYLDKIIMVTSNAELRIKRVMERDGVNREDVVKRMRNQWPENEKIKFADFVINNNDNQLLIPQVLAIHKQLLKQP